MTSPGTNTSVVATYCVYSSLFYGSSCCDDDTGGTVCHTVSTSAAVAVTKVWMVPWGTFDCSRAFDTRDGSNGGGGDEYGFGDRLKGFVPIDNNRYEKELNVVERSPNNEDSTSGTNATSLSFSANVFIAADFATSANVDTGGIPVAVNAAASAHGSRSRVCHI